MFIPRPWPIVDDLEHKANWSDSFDLEHNASETAADKQGVEAVTSWFSQLPSKPQNVAHLHFYFHDVVTSEHPTAVKVAESPLSKTFKTGFGFLNVVDDKITAGPDPNSEELGRAQGMYGSSDQKERAFITGLSFVFTAGPYNGSTLSMLGRNPILRKNHELPIVGGTGVFRLATGVAVLNTIRRNPVTRNAMVEYDVFVLHY
ncbi:hypothetical protein V2J09_003150 [Rumex salicifolius]